MGTSQVADRLAEREGIMTKYTTAYFEDVTYRLSNNALRVHLGSDCVIVGASVPRGWQADTREDGTVVNEFGMRMRQGPVYMEVIEPPLAQARTAQDLAETPWPDPLARGRYDDALSELEQFGGEYFVIGDMELTMFDMMQQLVGLEKLLVDMVKPEPYIEPLADRCAEFALAVGKRLVEMGVDGVWCGDDFGSQTGMLISPRMWRKLFKGRYERIYNELKEMNSRVIIMQHCDGAVAPILGEWAEVGMQVFNPVQPNVPGHDPQTLKERFGDKMSFWGAIDQQRLLPFGTPAEIEADVLEKISTLGVNGGYMCSPAHIIQADTSLENFDAFVRAVQQLGSYGDDFSPSVACAPGSSLVV